MNGTELFAFLLYGFGAIWVGVGAGWVMHRIKDLWALPWLGWLIWTIIWVWFTVDVLKLA